jgi:hypothetical protein
VLEAAPGLHLADDQQPATTADQVDLAAGHGTLRRTRKPCSHSHQAASRSARLP